MRSLTKVFSLPSIIATSFLIAHALALNRTIGPPDDRRFIYASGFCNGSDPLKFKFGVCSVLVACIYEHLDEAFKASLSSGTNIASLLPTILVLIGSSPLELVELAFLSPHRALAACCFGIGLPSSLFRQLRPLRLQPLSPDASQLRVREWTVILPAVCRSRWRHLLVKVVVDIAIIAMVCIMFWRNLEVASFTMVPWRCEYPWLLPAWPIACIIWLLIAVALLYFMKETIHIYNPADPSVEYTIFGVMLLPYTCTLKHDSEPEPQFSASSSHGEEMETITTSYPSSSSLPFGRRRPGSPLLPPMLRRSETSLLQGSNCVTIRIVMPSNFGFRSWRWYETLIETLSVGIYLYATFVLTSLLFLNADKAIGYATVMAICLSVVRVLAVLF